MVRAMQVDEEDQEFQEEFLGDKDPSILHFLLASGEEVQTRHDIHLTCCLVQMKAFI